MKEFIADFKKHSFLLQYLITKDFKVKYRRSVLGIAWSVLNPLFMMLIVSAVFSNVFRAGMPDPSISYPMYVILGQTMFSLLSDATTNSMQSILSASSLIKKVYIPKYIFPLEKTGFAFVNFLISMAAVVAVGCFERIGISWHLALVPLVFATFFLFCLGLGLLLSTLTVFFRDTVHIHSIVMTAWMYLTPVFYTIDILTGRAANTWWKAILFRLFAYNPMYQYILAFRNCVLFHRCPSLKETGLCVGFALVTFLLGVLAFRKKQDKFILYI